MMFSRTHGESIPIPVYNAALPFCLGEEIADDLVQSQTFIRNGQPYAFESSFFQVTQEVAPGFLVFLQPSATPGISRYLSSFTPTATRTAPPTGHFRDSAPDPEEGVLLDITGNGTDQQAGTGGVVHTCRGTSCELRIQNHGFA